MSGHRRAPPTSLAHLATGALRAEPSTSADGIHDTTEQKTQRPSQLVATCRSILTRGLDNTLTNTLT
jgi:hypothetical protein